jgi:hypothetical protein
VSAPARLALMRLAPVRLAPPARSSGSDRLPRRSSVRS